MNRKQRRDAKNARHRDNEQRRDIARGWGRVFSEKRQKMRVRYNCTGKGLPPSLVDEVCD